MENPPLRADPDARPAPVLLRIPGHKPCPLPPAFIAVGTLDLFCMSCLNYTARLTCAGVNTEFHIIPGVFHGFDLLMPDSPQTTLYNQLRIAQIKRMLGE